MLETQSQLDQRYRGLRDSRRGPVFFIEHGLNEDELRPLVADVRTALKTHPLESGWWRSRSLSLIVAATEVGYNYRGTGTDFWPILEDSFEKNLSASDRQNIRNLFEEASKVYRGATPAHTSWAQAFRLIAWPITHALMPREFHRRFALALANLHVNVAKLSDAELYQAIKIAAANSSARFSTLLEDSKLIIELTKGLLGVGITELCPETLRRIEADLDTDTVARRGVAAARRVQRTPPEPSTSSASSPREALPPVTGTLQLRNRNGTLSLEGVFPVRQTESHTKLRRALRLRRYSPRLWGVSAGVPSEQLLSGLPFPLKMTSLPPEAAELLPDLQELDLGEDLRKLLSAFECDITAPLLFAVSADEELGRRITGPNISGHRKYWLLSETNDGLADCPILGVIGPYTCSLLDPEENSAKDALSNLGFNVRFGISAGLSGAPPFDRDAVTPVFKTGDQLIVVPRRIPAEGVTVLVDEERADLLEDEVASIIVDRGVHTLRVVNEDQVRDFSFIGTSAKSSNPPSTCSISTHTDELTTQALLRGELGFAIESHVPLGGLPLTVEFQASGRRLYATTQLPPLPCSVRSDQEPFATLLENEETHRLLARAPSLELRLTVGHLCTYSLVLEQRPRPCWWEQLHDGDFRLLSEIGELSFGFVPANDPTATPIEVFKEIPNEPGLLVPTSVSESENGIASNFTTLCISPNKGELRQPTFDKPRLLRRTASEGRDLGLRDLTESYLRWALAESSNLLADLKRRQIVKQLDGWIVEACCGQAWANGEKFVEIDDPWLSLQKALAENEICRDDYVTLTAQQKQKICILTADEIRNVFPDLWHLRFPENELECQDYEVLNNTIERAYENLKKTYPELDEPDIWHGNAKWNAVLEQVISLMELRPLASLLFPTDTSGHLISLNPTLATLTELADELNNWAQNSRRALTGRLESDQDLITILALWAAPELAIKRDWQSALDVMLSERMVSRAARYLAVRAFRTTRRSIIR